MSQPRITRNEVTRELPVVFGDEEREEHTKRLLAALEREEALKADLAGYRADINAKLKETRKTIKDMRHALDAGCEQQAVACEEVWNFEREPVLVEALGVTVEPNSVSVVRLDTKEIVDTREIKPEERQQSMLGQDEEPPEGGGGAAEYTQPPIAELEARECPFPAVREEICGECERAEGEGCMDCCFGCEYQRDHGGMPAGCIPVRYCPHCGADVGDWVNSEPFCLGCKAALSRDELLTERPAPLTEPPVGQQPEAGDAA